MACEFRIIVFNETEAEKEGCWGGVGHSFTGMTAPMRTTMMQYLRATLGKLEQHERDHPEGQDADEEVRDGAGSEGPAGDRRRQEDGQAELHAGGRASAGRGEQEGRPGLILPPGVASRLGRTAEGDGG